MHPLSSPDLVALAGPNGAGKSTVGPALLRDSLGISNFVNADVIAQGLSGLEPEGAAFAAGRRRYHSGLRNFFELYRPLATSWQMHDNSTGGQVGPRLIARGRYSSVETVLERQTWAAIEGSIRRES